MPLVKTAAEINLEIKADMPTPPLPPSSGKPEKQLGILQYSLLGEIRKQPYWVVDRMFWNDMAERLEIRPWRVRKVFDSLQRGGYILVSERDDPRLVWAKDRGQR